MFPWLNRKNKTARPALSVGAPVRGMRELSDSNRTVAGVPRKGIGQEVASLATLEGAPADDKNQPDDESKKLKKVVERAKIRFRKAAEADSQAREQGIKAFQFYVGDQWDPAVKNDRFNAQRPCLTIDRVRPTVKLVCNEYRQMRPSVQVNPVGGNADIEVAEIMEGMIRHIETQSDAEGVYDDAEELMVAVGRGAFRIITAWASDDWENDPKSAMDQELKIEPIKNPFSVYWDPSAIKKDRSDALYCFITEDMDRDEYAAMYPDSAMSTLASFRGTGDDADWYPEGAKIRVAEYFEVDNDAQQIALLEDGTVKLLKNIAPGDVVKRKRMVSGRAIHWYKMNAVEVLEEREMPGEYIPVIQMIADEYALNNKRVVMGLVHSMMDAQRQYNASRSGAVEVVFLASKSPWLVAEGQTEGHEEEWKKANIANLPFLTYKLISGPDGVPAPPPIRNQAEPPIQAMSQLMQQADNDLKATSGIYDASLGRPGPERSGRAITAQQQMGSTATFSYSDNAARAIKYCGKVLVGMIPKVYDAARVVRVLKPDGTAQMTPVNQHFVPKITPNGDTDHQIVPEVIEGLSKFYDLTVGKYDVTVQMGPSYTSKRQEAFASLIDLAKAFPEIMQVAGDIITANWDAPFAQELSKRMKTLLPPQIQQMEAQSSGAQPQISPAVVAQQQQQIQALMAQLQALAQVLREKKLEIDSKERVALSKNIADIMVAEIKARQLDGSQMGEWNFDAVHRMADMISSEMQQEAQDRQAGMTQASDQTHQASMAAMEQAHQRAMQQEQQAATPPQPQQPSNPQ